MWWWLYMLGSIQASAQLCTQTTNEGYLYIPANTTSIPTHAASNCTNLTVLVVPSTVTYIGTAAFANCTRLTQVVFQHQNVTLDDYSFANCHRLTTIVNSSNISVYGEYVFTQTLVATIELASSAVITPTSFTQAGCIPLVYRANTSLCNCTNCTTIPNYNPLYFQRADLHLHSTCETWCLATPGCQGYIQTKQFVYPARCELAVTLLPLRIETTLTTVAVEYTSFIPLECAAYTSYPPCFVETRTCMVCPDQLFAWQTEVESGYTVYFRADCCLANATDTPTILTLDTPYAIQVNNLTFKSEPHIQLHTTHCPLFFTNPTPQITTVAFQQLHIVCTNTTTTNAAGILTQYTRRIRLSVDTVTVEHALSALTVLGGSQNHPALIPQFTTTDLSLSQFKHVVAESDEYPVTAALALAAYTGIFINFGTFEPQQLVVIQPALNDDRQPTPFNLSADTNIRLFNISAFTAVFGVDYEISFSHGGAFALNEDTITNAVLAKYQTYLMLFLLGILFILHQDLLYYYRQDQLKNTQ
jgi:hypothetical protein